MKPHLTFVNPYIVLALASTFAAASLGAQATRPSAGRIAGIAPPPAADTAHPERRREDERRESEGRDGYRRPAVQVLQDGRVFADFGRGYEQVVLQCGTPVTASIPAAPLSVRSGGVVQPSVAQPAPVQPVAGSGQSVPFTSPAPALPTASQQAAQPQSSVAGRSCWAVDARGQVFIARP